MSFTVEELENKTAKLTIEVPAEDLEKALQNAYNKNKGKLSIPGFRKGKAPRNMVEKMYGAGIFYEDAANELISAEYPKAAKESKLDIVAQPEIDITQIEKGKSFIFTALVTLKPDVELGTYKGVEIEKVETELEADAVDKEIEKVREQQSRLVSVEDRAVMDKDQAVIDFEGFIDGEAFEGGKGEDYPLTIGSHSFIDNFEDQIIGKNIGDEFDVNVTFPEDYQKEELAGKPAVFKVKVKEIKVKELPELNDEFASEISDFETLAEYKEDLQKKLAEAKEKDAKAEKQKRAVDAVVKEAKMDIPDAMVSSQVNNMMRNYAQNLSQQGLSLDMYLSYMGSTQAQFAETLKPEAVIRIKNSLVLEKVAETENFEITEEELDKEFSRMAEMYRMEVDKVKELVGEEGKEDIKADLKIQKAAEFIADNAVEK